MKKIWVVALLLLCPAVVWGADFAPELIWYGGGVQLTDESKPAYDADLFVSLGDYENFSFFAQPQVSARGGEWGANIGLGARTAALADNVMAGANLFFDYTSDNDHKRVGLGGEIYHPNFSAHLNLYLPLTDRNGRQEALPGFDLTAVIPIPEMSFLAVCPGIYMFKGEDEKDMQGISLALEARPMDILTARLGVRGDALDSGRDEVEFFAMVRVAMPMSTLGKDLYSFNKGSYPVDTAQKLAERVRREYPITFERKTMPWDMFD